VKLVSDLAGKLKSGAKLVEADGIASRLRQSKDELELAAMRKAIRIAEQAFKELFSLGAKGWIGRTERDLAAELDYRMRKAGADALAFPTIFAAGAHGSVPHYCPDSTRIKPDQAVLIDWGASAGGYCSDLTRVVFTGTIPAKIKEIYEVVRRSQAAGIAAIRPGAACKAVDAAAREVIEKAGFGPKFGHGLGHGLGREVHENPRLGKLSPARLASGMVITVEPGIYLPGIGGVRIEDDVLVTGTSSRRLTSLPRDLEAMRL
jgi:Xaa-Pro aminopeptidase